MGDLQAYNEGVLAFKQGKPAECSRDKRPMYRQQWYDGWYDAYFSAKFEWWLDE